MTNGRFYNAELTRSRWCIATMPRGGSLQVVSPAPPIARRRVPTLAALAKPAGQVAGLLLVEVLSSPRGRAVALGLARSLGHRVAGGRSSVSARARVFTTAWRVTVVEESDVVAVLVRRVETPVPDWKRSQAGAVTDPA
jgi:hypothetical protein